MRKCSLGRCDAADVGGRLESNDIVGAAEGSRAVGFAVVVVAGDSVDISSGVVVGLYELGIFSESLVLDEVVGIIVVGAEDIVVAD